MEGFLLFMALVFGSISVALVLCVVAFALGWIIYGFMVAFGHELTDTPERDRNRRLG